MLNQNPEQIARDQIDKQLSECGWIIQNKQRINLHAGLGVAIREYQTDVGPADYVLFVGGKPVGIIEAKREEEGQKFSVHEGQIEEYAKAKLKLINNEPLPFLYLSTGAITRFADTRDPKPRFREVFTFHRPEGLQNWLRKEKSLRRRMAEDMPALITDGLRDCQIDAITKLEESFKKNKPKALIQMATGSGKTFTAITFIYRLLKNVKANKVLFLVDTKNLGEQAEGEFRSYIPQDDNRLFPELHGVVRLNSSFVPQDCQVYISTIQRLYSILKGTELDESAEQENPNELKSFAKEAMPVVYNEKIPIEFFDFIVIDECHRSIYNLWKQVLDYFDAFQVGLTATPDNRTFGYFNQNVVSDYGYEKAVIDGVLVPYNVYTIETQITQQGAALKMGEMVDKRERLTRKKFWEAVDEDVEYSGKQLDRDIVNPSTIRSIIREVKNTLPAIFPDRISGDGSFEVPKMLVFAKTDSHAEDIIEIIREEFDESNDFCKKITYQSSEDPKTILNSFRNLYYPRIAVTVDMIATGTDVRPLEVLLFMRDVKSRSYYEQMKGRGTRTCSIEELRAKGTPSAKFSKDHFVIIDAIGVEQSQKTDSRPLEKAPGVSLKEVLQRIAVGDRSEEILTTLANRLLRLDKQINTHEKETFSSLAEGKNIAHVVKQLLNAYDPDTVEGVRTSVQSDKKGFPPAEIESAIKAEQQQIVEQAVAVFHNPDLRDFITDVRKKYDQIIDTLNQDTIIKSGWVKDIEAEAQQTVQGFKVWIETHKDEITSLQLFYGQPYQRRELTYKMIKELSQKLVLDKPNLAPMQVWKAYQKLEDAGSPLSEMIALVSLVRRIIGIDEILTLYDKTVDKNFQDWVWKRHSGAGHKFSEEQMEWLRMIKEHVTSSFHIEKDDFDYNPFNSQGGLARMWQLFGDETEEIINELNEVLAA
ncbi:Type I site-specific deoxyribonuclease [Paludibacter propionicigenes WB4]|uniref:Type I site-specific deoxyribonuclease n=1 Tax=Paludibacter propionicigenes (strain DSM 17365 / JCM 13257 / WB4) TaxID=694427 RepID=E4T0M0_PALPW|nr:DEAD/DEAH box helicase family protein [Paludibacter propionicigenes]ADQ81084.1 Type I site-specific deoxyribonuclease [Paludibacter propionicigenes WB4]